MLSDQTPISPAFGARVDLKGLYTADPARFELATSAFGGNFAGSSE